MVTAGGYVKCNISDSNFDKCANSSLGKLVSAGVKGNHLHTRNY